MCLQEHKHWDKRFNCVSGAVMNMEQFNYLSVYKWNLCQYLPVCPDLFSLEVTRWLSLGSFSVTDWWIRESEAWIFALNFLDPNVMKNEFMHEEFSKVRVSEWNWIQLWLGKWCTNINQIKAFKVGKANFWDSIIRCIHTYDILKSVICLPDCLHSFTTPPHKKKERRKDFIKITSECYCNLEFNCLACH